MHNRRNACEDAYKKMHDAGAETHSKKTAYRLIPPGVMGPEGLESLGE